DLTSQVIGACSAGGGDRFLSPLVLRQGMRNFASAFKGFAYPPVSDALKYLVQRRERGLGADSLQGFAQVLQAIIDSAPFHQRVTELPGACDNDLLHGLVAGVGCSLSQDGVATFAVSGDRVVNPTLGQINVGNFC